MLNTLKAKHKVHVWRFSIDMNKPVSAPLKKLCVCHPSPPSSCQKSWGGSGGHVAGSTPRISRAVRNRSSIAFLTSPSCRPYAPARTPTTDNAGSEGSFHPFRVDTCSEFQSHRTHTASRSGTRRSCLRIPHSASRIESILEVASQASVHPPAGWPHHDIYRVRLKRGVLDIYPRPHLVTLGHLLLDLGPGEHLRVRHEDGERAGGFTHPSVPQTVV